MSAAATLSNERLRPRGEDGVECIVLLIAFVDAVDIVGDGGDLESPGGAGPGPFPGWPGVGAQYSLRAGGEGIVKGVAPADSFAIYCDGDSVGNGR